MREIKHAWTGRASAVALIDYMGDEDRICEVARISYNREDTKAKERLLWRLLSDGHGSPFEHVDFEFFIHAPIPVRTQLFRHRLASPNELSGRYVNGTQNGFYVPEMGETEREDYLAVIQEAVNMYQRLMRKGIARGTARMILPQGLMTKFYFKVNARSLMNILNQRLSYHAQSETAELATMLYEAMKLILPNVADMLFKLYPTMRNVYHDMVRYIIYEEKPEVPWEPNIRDREFFLEGIETGI